MSLEVSERWQRPIFVASMGRSGSTLLQRVLNVHPDLTIWGEHAGFLSGILASYTAANHPDAAQNLINGYEHRQMVIGELSDKETFKPWVSPFRPDHLTSAIQSMMIGLFTEGLNQSIRWGFKEIRYTDTELRALMQLFPQAHLIVLGRDVPGYAMSRFFAFGNTDFDLSTDEGREKANKRLTTISNGWIARYQGLLALQSEFADRSSIVAYSDLTPESDRVQRLFSELGEPAARQEAIDTVLSSVAGSSYRHNSAARAGRDQLEALLASLDVDWDECARLSGALGLS